MVSRISFRNELIKNKRTIRVVVFIVTFIMIWFQLKRNHTKQQPAEQQRCYEFHYNYPLNNVTDILNELRENNTTSSQQINHIYNQYSTIYNVKCAAYTELIILVKSYIGHFYQRRAIRSTWGKCHGENVRVVFLLGYSAEFDDQVRDEYVEYKDMIQGSFRDNYRNNIYKTLMAHNWVVSNCSDSKFVFFVDDDYFVTIPNLLKFSRDKKWDGRDVMFGHKQCNPKNPVRSKSSRHRKWYISEEEYQPPILPPFLSGGSVLTHINVVRKLRTAFPYMKTIFLDDVYVSLVAQKIGITILHDERFVNAEVRRMDFNFIISCHNYNSTDYLDKAWLKFKKINKFPCKQ